MSDVRGVVYENGLQRPSNVGDGILSNVNLVTIATDANLTLTAGQIAGGAVRFSGFSVGRTVTTDTAANILAAFPSLSVGESKMIVVSVTPAFAATWSAGTNVTLAGRATTPASSYSLVVITKTSSTTVLWTVL